jgi:hypothetical protein
MYGRTRRLIKARSQSLSGASFVVGVGSTTDCSFLYSGTSLLLIPSCSSMRHDSRYRAALLSDACMHLLKAPVPTIVRVQLCGPVSGFEYMDLQHTCATAS